MTAHERYDNGDVVLTISRSGRNHLSAGVVKDARDKGASVTSDCHHVLERTA